MKGTGKRGLKRLALLLMAALLACGCLSACRAAEPAGMQEGAAASPDEQLKQQAADVINAAFGTKFSGEDLIITDILPLTTVEILSSSRDEEAEDRYCAYFMRDTGALIWTGKEVGPHVKSLAELPDISKTIRRQNEKRIAKVAMKALTRVTGAKPKAYFVDGSIGLFDADDSISTGCYILLDNGEHYMVDIIFPGYELSALHKLGEANPFPTEEELANGPYEVWGVY